MPPTVRHVVVECQASRGEPDVLIAAGAAYLRTTPEYFAGLVDVRQAVYVPDMVNDLFSAYQGRPPLESVALLGHGEPGCIQFGNNTGSAHQRISHELIPDVLKHVGRIIKPGGALHFAACSIAANNWLEGAPGSEVAGAKLLCGVSALTGVRTTGPFCGFHPTELEFDGRPKALTLLESDAKVCKEPLKPIPMPSCPQLRPPDAHYPDTVRAALLAFPEFEDFVPPQVFDISGFAAAIAYAGPVPGARGVWIGISWPSGSPMVTVVAGAKRFGAPITLDKAAAARAWLDRRVRLGVVPN